MSSAGITGKSFLSTLSLRRATVGIGQIRTVKKVSIHALLAESDHFSFYSQQWHLTFLSTLSLRRATVRTNYHIGVRKSFYPRSPCGERLEQSSSYNAYLEVSIHALLAESDPSSTRKLTNMMVSIHALLAESDEGGKDANDSTNRFLSTLSLRRATNCTSIGRPKRLCFYPRSPCGERRKVPLLGIK